MQVPVQKERISFLAIVFRRAHLQSWQRDLPQLRSKEIFLRFFNLISAQMTDSFELERTKQRNAQSQKTLAPHQHIEQSERKKKRIQVFDCCSNKFYLLISLRKCKWSLLNLEKDSFKMKQFQFIIKEE